MEEINNKLLIGTDNERRTAWHLAALWGNLEALKKVCGWAKENLITDEVNNEIYQALKMREVTFWHVAAEQGNLETLQNICEWVKNRERKITNCY